MAEISVGRGRRIAIGTFLEFANDQAPLASDWTLLNLPEGLRAVEVFSAEPIRIDDINGLLLFYDYHTALEGDADLVVRVYANTVFGTPVDSIWKQVASNSYYPRFWGLSKRLRTVFGDRVHANIVCYCYPKLGVMVAGQDGTPTVVYDLFDETEHRVSDAEAASPVSDGTMLVYSLYQRIPESSDTSSRDAAFTEKEERYEAIVQAAEAAGISFRGGAEAGVGEKVLNVPLYGQETSVYCAVATGQMILEFHGFKRNQTEIAAAMNTGPSGTTNSDQVAGYESLSGKKLDASYDSSAKYSEARSQIDANRPVKSGVPGHARAVIGWKENATEKWLHVNDPWPVNLGQKRVEASDGAAWTNWIYIQRSVGV